jgi:hypothetical protein
MTSRSRRLLLITLPVAVALALAAIWLLWEPDSSVRWLPVQEWRVGTATHCILGRGSGITGIRETTIGPIQIVTLFRD